MFCARQKPRQQRDHKPRLWPGTAKRALLRYTRARRQNERTDRGMQQGPASKQNVRASCARQQKQSSAHRGMASGQGRQRGATAEPPVTQQHVFDGAQRGARRGPACRSGRPCAAGDDGGLRARPTWKQPAREGRLQPDGSKRPAMGSLCWYPMGKLRMQRSGQDAAGERSEKSVRGRRLAQRPTRRETCWLRSAGPPSRRARAGEGYSGASRKGVGKEEAECQALGLPCLP